MKQYKLINLTTKEETLCKKVEKDGFDYYVNDEVIRDGDVYIRIDTGLLFSTLKGNNPYILERYCKRVICSTNPNIDLPKVVDVVEELAEKRYTQITPSQRTAYKLGYNQSQSTHPFSDEDMIEFGDWKESKVRSGGVYVEMTTKELLQLFKDQQIKTVYYK